MSELSKFAIKYISFNPKAAASVLQKFSVPEIFDFLSEVDMDTLETILLSMEPFVVSALLSQFPREKAKAVISRFPSNFMVHVLQVIPEVQRSEIAGLISGGRRKQLERSMQYLPDTAGAYMDSRVICFRDTDTVDFCLQNLKKKVRSGYYLYIVNSDDKLVGVTTLRKMIQEQGEGQICAQIMEAPVISVKIDQNAHEIIENKGWLSFSCLPVVDYHEKFLGVIGHSIFAKIRGSFLGELDSPTVRSAGDALGELYSIGFTAFVGSVSSGPAGRNKDEH